MQISTITQALFLLFKGSWKNARARYVKRESLKTLHSMPLVSRANIQNPLALGFEVSL